MESRVSFRPALSILAAASAAALLAGCSGEKSLTYQGYVEGEYVNVASPIAGRLDKLLVQRGDGRGERAAVQPRSGAGARGEAAGPGAAQGGGGAARRSEASGAASPKAVTRAQLAQAEAAVEQRAALKRDEAQFDAGGIPRAQLDDSRARRQGRAGARACERARRDAAAGRADQIRAQGAQVAAARAAQSRRPGGSTRSGPRRARPGLVADTLYREGEWVAAGSPVVRMLPPRQREGALLRPGSRGRRPQAGPQRLRRLRRLRRRHRGRA